MSEQDGPPDVGSLGEEAARLMETFARWAHDQGRDVGDGVSDLAGAAAEAARGVDEHLATGGEECRYCPLCRVITAVRSTSPEVRAHLSTAANSMLLAAAGMISTHVPDDDRRSGFERIDVDGSDSGRDSDLDEEYDDEEYEDELDGESNEENQTP